MAEAKKDPWEPYDLIGRITKSKDYKKIQDLSNLKKNDVLRSMIVDFLRGNKATPSEYYAIVKRVVDYTDKTITSTDPFHELDVERARMLNGGILGNFKKKIIAYVEIPSIFSMMSAEDYPEFKGYEYQTLARVDISNADKTGKRHVQNNELIIISFADNKNLLYPTFKRFPKDQPMIVEAEVTSPKKSSKDAHKEGKKDKSDDSC